MFKSLPLKVSVLGALTLPPLPYYIPPLHLQTPSKLIRAHSIHCLTSHLLPNPFPSSLRLLSTPFTEVTSSVPAVKSSAHCPGLILLEVLASFRAAGHWLPFGTILSFLAFYDPALTLFPHFLSGYVSVPSADVYPASQPLYSHLPTTEFTLCSGLSHLFPKFKLSPMWSWFINRCLRFNPLSPSWSIDPVSFLTCALGCLRDSFSSAVLKLVPQPPNPVLFLCSLFVNGHHHASGSASLPLTQSIMEFWLFLTSWLSSEFSASLGFHPSQRQQRLSCGILH